MSKTQLNVGDRVIIKWMDEDEIRYGTITQVNDPDQGEFEYYVRHDDGTGSFWPREALKVSKRQALSNPDLNIPNEDLAGLPPEDGLGL